MKPADVAQTAVDVGSVSKAAATAAAAAVEHANPDTGVAATELKKKRVFLFQALVDNSGSLKGFEEPVRSAWDKMIGELTEASEDADCEFLVSLSLLHGGQILPYCRIAEAIRLDNSNHTCDGDTPLFERAEEMLGTLVAKVAEIAESARTAQTYTVFITDGEANPDKGEGGFNRAGVGKLIKGLTETKQHIIAGVSINGAADHTFAEMGISKKWMLDPARDSMAFDAAIAQVSRASKSASKGAGAFQTVANGGFR